MGGVDVTGWAPVTMRWPEQATQWVDGLGAAKELAGGELASTALRLASLDLSLIHISEPTRPY